MSVPKSVTRLTKNGVEFTSSVDRVNYTLKELIRAALRDVGKFVVVETNKKAQTLYYNSMRRSKRVRGTTKGAFQYWARAKTCDLQVGIKHDTWYGTGQELGSSKMKKHGYLTASVKNNIPTIIQIESQYLSALEDEARALSLISEEEYKGGAE